jgi:hypothetical protein
MLPAGFVLLVELKRPKRGLAKGEHCVPLYAAVALNLEVCHPRMILSGAHSSSP